MARNDTLTAALARIMSRLNWGGAIEKVDRHGEQIRNFADVDIPHPGRYSPELEAINRGLTGWIDTPPVEFIRDSFSPGPPPPQEITIGPKLYPPENPVNIPTSSRIERYPEQPITHGNDMQPPMIAGWDQRGGPPESPLPREHPMAGMFDNDRDYGADADAQRNKDLANMLLAFGGGMGTAPLGDVTGGMARGGAMWGDVYKDTLSREDYIRGEKDKDLARVGMRADVAGKLQDVMTGDPAQQQQRMLTSMIQEQVPREQWGEALYYLQTKDFESLGKMLNYSPPDSRTISGMQVQTRTGADGFEEVLFPGRQGEWISTQDPNYQQVENEAYLHSASMIRHQADVAERAQRGSGNPGDWLREDGGGEDKPYDRLYDEANEVRKGMEDFRLMTEEQQAAQIQQVMSDSEFVADFQDNYGRGPTFDDVWKILSMGPDAVIN